MFCVFDIWSHQVYKVIIARKFSFHSIRDLIVFYSEFFLSFFRHDISFGFILLSTSNIRELKISVIVFIKINRRILFIIWIYLCLHKRFCLQLLNWLFFFEKLLILLFYLFHLNIWNLRSYELFLFNCNVGSQWEKNITFISRDKVAVRVFFWNCFNLLWSELWIFELHLFILGCVNCFLQFNNIIDVNFKLWVNFYRSVSTLFSF